MGKLEAFVRSVTLRREQVRNFDEYPFNIPAVRSLETLELHPKVTFFVGENGSGKSTLLEAIAVACGFNPEGGSRNFRFNTRASESELHRCLRVARGTRRPRDGFFLRAESSFNLATEIERLDREFSFGPPIINSFGFTSLHEQSHGESFLALLDHRLGGDGLYLFDEPEAALSPQRQLTLLSTIDRLARHQRSQFIIATHSPIVLAYPQAKIFHVSDDGLNPVAYEQTEHYALTRDFLLNRERYLARLLDQNDA